MKAVGVTRFGGPEVLAVYDLPEPHAGPGQVRVRVHAATVNPGDRYIRNGAVDLGTLRPPYILGLEAAGVLDEIGPETVTSLRVGDPVMAVAAPAEATGGAYAEYVVLPAWRVARAPAGRSHAEAATLPMNGLTARHALDLIEPTPGQTVAVTGSAGAVGGYVVQMAKSQGLTVVAVAGPADEELVRGLGADLVVGWEGGLGRNLLRAVPEGVHGLVDTVGAGAAALAAVRDGAAVSSPVGGVRSPDLRRRSIRSSTALYSEYLDREGARLDRLRDQVEKDELTLRVARTLRPEEAGTAHRLLETRGIRGRLVLEF
ncbi:NADP-dependent oxidoreductase [Streptomyces sp. E5N91]|uniref:NADP-dependent oxidoreductase n=1 Tax=Streptomyces sp. E5N91 TaxID=1851996 RepID=UPI000EF57E38|nr:NADP-dependent oxidoreductase [Streptomyces sp. E5N91]